MIEYTRNFSLQLVPKVTVEDRRTRGNYKKEVIAGNFTPNI